MLALLPVAVVLGFQAKPSRDSLAAAWPNLHWSVAERGPLLLVDGAAHYRLRFQDRPYDPFSHRNGNLAEDDEDEPPPLLPPPPKGGYNLGSLLPEFGCEVVRFPSVSVIAPSRTYQFAPPRDFPSLSAILEAKDPDRAEECEPLLYSLLASLTPAQWAEAGTERGVALSQLAPAQQAKLFASMPRSLYFHFAAGVPVPTWLRTEDPPFLPDALRQELRLVLRRGLMGLPRPKTTEESAEVRVRENTTDEATEQVEAALTGYVLLPNRRRETQLPPTHPALQTSLSLAGATTVQALVARIATVSRFPLVVDAALAPTPVQALGSSAKAGEVLAALCQALGGTVRRIEEKGKVAYLLTDSVLTEAQRAAQVRPGQLASEIADAQRMYQHNADLAKHWQTLSTEPAIGRLPKGIGKEYPDAIWNRTKDGFPVPTPSGEPQDLRRHVRVRDVIEVGLYLPLLHATATLATPTLPKAVPPLPLILLPTHVPTRALLTRLPTDPAQTEELLARVNAFGFTELRIPMAPREADESALAAFGAAVKKAKLGLVPVVSVLNATSPEQSRERSPLGQTFQEWLVTPLTEQILGFLGPNSHRFETQADLVTPEAADATAIAQALKRLSLLPGVTEIGLTDLAAPGYRPPYTADSSDAFRLDSFPNDTWRAWGLPGQRVAFILQHHADPDDLDVGVRRQGETMPAWNQLQATRRDAFLARLNQAIKTAKIPLPLSAQNGVSGSWLPWNGRYPKRTPEAAGLEPEPFRRYLRAAIKKLGTGVLLDLDPLPLDEALTVLSRSLQPQEVRK